jgi:uncharacterized protein (DUF58 family)
VSFTPITAWLAVGIALTGLFVPTPVAALALVALVTAALLDAFAARRSPHVEVEVPRMLSRGVPAPLIVRASSRDASRVRVRQPVVPDIDVDPGEGAAPLLASIIARRRGLHSLPPAAVRVVGPLSLGTWTHPAGSARDLTVYPDMPAARRLAVLVREGKFRDLRDRGPLGLGTDFESIRDYVPDDDVRRINWAATARTGRPMTNQYRVEQDRDVICLIDCGRLMAAPLNDRTRLDAAVDAATAVVLVADVSGDHSGVVAFDSSIRRDLRPRRAGGLVVVRSIFDLESTDVESDYELAFRAVGSSKRSLVVVFTDIFEESAARPLIDAVPVLARHHHVIVASSTDTDLAAIIARDPTSREDVMNAVVATEVLEARTRVERALRQAGAEVIEAPPEALGAECVRRYLRAKARARL